MAPSVRKRTELAFSRVRRLRRSYFWCRGCVRVAKISHSVATLYRQNRLLACLPADALERLTPHFELVELKANAPIYHPGQAIQKSYFPTGSLVSLVKTMSNGRTVEIGAIGTEGVTGPDALFGLDDALLECVVRIPGTALRIRSDLLRLEMARNEAVHALFARFIVSVFNQIAQTAACNRLHTLDQRCCRWLLTAQESLNRDKLAVTHEFLARLLGVQRAGVSLTLEALESKGYIKSGRGFVIVSDVRGLKAAACECHTVMRGQRDQIFAAAS